MATYHRIIQSWNHTLLLPPQRKKWKSPAQLTTFHRSQARERTWFPPAVLQYSTVIHVSGIFLLLLCHWAILRIVTHFWDSLPMYVHYAIPCIREEAHPNDHLLFEHTHTPHPTGSRASYYYYYYYYYCDIAWTPLLNDRWMGRQKDDISFLGNLCLASILSCTVTPATSASGRTLCFRITRGMFRVYVSNNSFRGGAEGGGLYILHTIQYIHIHTCAGYSTYISIYRCVFPGAWKVWGWGVPLDYTEVLYSSRDTFILY